MSEQRGATRDELLKRLRHAGASWPNDASLSKLLNDAADAIRAIPEDLRSAPLLPHRRRHARSAKSPIRISDTTRRENGNDCAR